MFLAPGLHSIEVKTVALRPEGSESSSHDLFVSFWHGSGGKGILFHRVDLRMSEDFVSKQHHAAIE